jgi:cobalamin biosynthesis protein CobT
VGGDTKNDVEVEDDDGGEKEEEGEAEHMAKTDETGDTNEEEAEYEEENEGEDKENEEEEDEENEENDDDEEDDDDDGIDSVSDLRVDILLCCPSPISCGVRPLTHSPSHTTSSSPLPEFPSSSLPGVCDSESGYKLYTYTWSPK